MTTRLDWVAACVALAKRNDGRFTAIRIEDAETLIAAARAGKVLADAIGSTDAYYVFKELDEFDKIFEPLLEPAP